ncbi:unnamed protein product [Symbiodinium microadriaticum]|nr:unnamed protein product [Symbiodinium microadriaticum]
MLPTTSLADITRSAKRSWTWSLTGSASWPTTAAGQTTLSAFGITCTLTLRMGLWNVPASNSSRHCIN